MSIRHISFFILFGPLPRLLAAGFEYDRTVAGVHISDLNIGLANFRHISNGTIEGRLLLEPFATIPLPFRAEIALLAVTSALLIVALCGQRYLRYRKGQLKPNTE